MSKTTDGERAGAMGERTIHGREFILRLVSDADRLAELEQELRDLVERIESAAADNRKTANESAVYSDKAAAYWCGMASAQGCDARLLRVLLDPPTIRDPEEPTDDERAEALDALSKVRSLSGGWASSDVVDHYEETVRRYIERQSVQDEADDADSRLWRLYP